jgi:hypothetical protein
MLPGFSSEGAKVLPKRLQASAIHDDDGPTTIRITTVPPHHLCCHAAAQVVVVVWLGRGTTAVRNNQKPTRTAQQEAAAPENDTGRHNRQRGRGACRREAVVQQEAAKQPARGQEGCGKRWWCDERRKATAVGSVGLLLV